MARKVLIIAGVVSLFQALAQIIITSLCIGQYFCTIDFLRELPYLIFIKILYFSNPSSCGSVINIGQAIDGIANQAFVLIETEPYTSTRTFIISCTSLIVGCMWALASCTLLDVGTRSQYSRLVRWSWVTTTVSICAVDVVATICYANDSFHTRTLNDIMKYIGGSASGTGGTSIDTSAASLIMVLLYSRCLVFFVLNVILIVLVALPKDDEGKPVEAPVTETPVISSSHETSPPVQPKATPAQKPRRLVKQNNVDVDDISFDEKSKKDKAWPDIPRVHYSNAFHTMKKYIFKRNFSMESQGDPEILSDRLRYGKARRLMHFCENPVTLPRLRGDVHREYYTDGPGTAAPHAAPALPVFNEITEEAGPSFNKGRRDTVAELQKQMPWSYIPSAFRRMRDQLPSDEDLPPVPLADYTAIGRTRKASVHRAASNLNSRKNYKTEL